MCAVLFLINQRKTYYQFVCWLTYIAYLSDPIQLNVIRHMNVYTPLPGGYLFHIAEIMLNRVCIFLQISKLYPFAQTSHHQLYSVKMLGLILVKHAL